MTKRVLSILMALTLVLALFPALTPHVHAEADNEAGVTIGDDGRILAKYTHVHQHLDGYMQMENEQHQFNCACGETVTEDCKYDWRDYDGEHWLECVGCQRMNDATREPHSPQANCLCECGVYAHQVESWSLFKEEDNLHAGYCTACERPVTAGHNLTWGRDDQEHWTACTQDCGYKASVAEHQWYEWLPNVGGFHYRYCGCGMMQDERHTDSDSNLICDICNGNMCVDGNGDHICDDCHYTMDELCTDANGDHICDTTVCGERMEQLCVDANGDHICDTTACGKRMEQLCVDANGDHICDTAACKTYMNELCADANGDHICDNCGKSFLVAHVVNGALVLENIPAEMKTIVAGYSGGKMMVVQLVETVADSIPISEEVLACDEVKAFFLDGNCNPLINALLVQ